MSNKVILSLTLQQIEFAKLSLQQLEVRQSSFGQKAFKQAALLQLEKAVVWFFASVADTSMSLSQLGHSFEAVQEDKLSEFESLHCDASSWLRHLISVLNTLSEIKTTSSGEHAKHAVNLIAVSNTINDEHWSTVSKESIERMLRDFLELVERQNAMNIEY